MNRVLAAVGIVALILVAATVGASWYFSGMILDGVKVDGYSAEFGHEVTAVQADGDGGTITYNVDDSVEDPAGDHDTTARTGMIFPDGRYLHLHQGATVDGRSITRPYTGMVGGPPTIGDWGQYDGNSYSGPDSLGLLGRDVIYQAPKGPTPAVIVEPEGAPTGLWAIVVHGRNGSVREGLRAVPLYAERGMTTMLVNYRDDKKEPGAPHEDGIGNFGFTEWPDLQAAVDHAKAEGAQQVVLVGWSMGGAIVAAYLEHGENTDVVVATQLDSPAVSLHDIVVFGAEQMGLPTTPLAPVIWLSERITEVRAKVDFTAVEYLDNAATWPVPALVTAASDDDLVPPDSIEAFAQALPNGRFALFEDAAHTGEWNLESARYDELIGEWLDEVVLP